MADSLICSLLTLILALGSLGMAGEQGAAGWSLACFFVGTALFPLVEVFRPRNPRAFPGALPRRLTPWRPGRIAMTAGTALWLLAGVIWVVAPTELPWGYGLLVAILGVAMLPRAIARLRHAPSLIVGADGVECGGEAIAYSDLGGVRLLSEETGELLQLWRARSGAGRRLRREHRPQIEVELHDLGVDAVALTRWLVRRRLREQRAGA